MDSSAKLIANRFFLPRLEAFGSGLIKRGDETVMKYVKEKTYACILVMMKNRFKKDSEGRWIAKESILKMPFTQQQESEQKEEGDEEPLTWMKLICTSYSPHEKLLTEQVNPEFLKKQPNPFNARFRIGAVWNRASPDDKQWIWCNLHQLYVVSMCLTRLPSALFIHFHNLVLGKPIVPLKKALDKSDSKMVGSTMLDPTMVDPTMVDPSTSTELVPVEKKGTTGTMGTVAEKSLFSIKTLLFQAKVILSDVGSDNFGVMLSYLLYFIQHPFSPLPKLVPHDYEDYCERGLKLFQKGSGQKTVGNFIRPLLKLARDKYKLPVDIPKKKLLKNEDGKMDEGKMNDYVQKMIQSLVQVDEKVLEKIWTDKDAVQADFTSAGKQMLNDMMKGKRVTYDDSEDDSESSDDDAEETGMDFAILVLEVTGKKTKPSQEEVD